MGLVAKNTWSTVSVEQHVTYGSHGIASKYISCCKSEQAVRKLASMSRTHPRRIAMFYINERDINIIDLTDPFIRDCFISNITGRHYAANFEEVLIENNIPKECFVGYIYLKLMFQTSMGFFLLFLIFQKFCWIYFEL